MAYRNVRFRAGALPKDFILGLAEHGHTTIRLDVPDKEPDRRDSLSKICVRAAFREDGRQDGLNTVAECDGTGAGGKIGE